CRGELDAARLAPAAGVDLGLHHDIAAQVGGELLRLRRRGGNAALEHGHARDLEQLAGLILVQIHSSLTMVVPVSPRMAAGPSESRALTARAPPDRTKSAPAWTFGFMLPVPSPVPASIASAWASDIRRSGFARGVPQSV